MPQAADLPKGWTVCNFWHVSLGVGDDDVLKSRDIFAFKGGAAALDALAARKGKAE